LARGDAAGFAGAAFPAWRGSTKSCTLRCGKSIGAQHCGRPIDAWRRGGLRWRLPPCLARFDEKLRAALR